MSTQPQPQNTIHLTFFFAGSAMHITAEGGNQLCQWYQAIVADEKINPDMGSDTLKTASALTVLAAIRQRPAQDMSFKFPIQGCGTDYEFGPILGGLFGVGMRERAQDVVYVIREIMNGAPNHKYTINLVGFSRGGVTLLLVLKALSAGFMIPDCKINVLTVDPVPGVPLPFTDTGAALESWRVMRELLPLGDCPGGVRRAIYFHRQPKFHTALAVPEDWDTTVFSGCHAGAVARIEPGSPVLPELMLATRVFHQFVQEAGIPRVDFSALTPRLPDEVGLSLPQYFQKKHDEFVEHTTGLVNKNENTMHPDRVDAVLKESLSATCFCPARFGPGIVVNPVLSTNIRQRYNHTSLLVIVLAQSVLTLRQLMRHLPLQQSRRESNPKLAVYRMLSDSIERHADTVSAVRLLQWFGCLAILCVQPRKKPEPTHNGLALLAAIHGMNRAGLGSRQVIKPSRQLLKYLFGNYSNQFINYPMLVRHAANALYLFAAKTEAVDYPEDAFPNNTRRAGINLLLSPDRTEQNFVIVSRVIGQIGV